MKKLRWLILVVAAMMGLALFAACTPSEPQTTTYTVTYYDGSNVLKTESVEEGGKATNWTPQKEGYNFEGWWATPGFTHEFKFEEVTINADTSVFSQWSSATQSVDTRTYYIVGAGTSPILSASNWGKVFNETTQMTKATDKNEYTYTVDLYVGDLFQFAINESWHNQRGVGYLDKLTLADGTEAFSGASTIGDNSSYRLNIKCEYAGNYTFTLTTHPDDDTYETSHASYTEANKEAFNINPLDTITWVRNGDVTAEVEVVTDYFIKGAGITDWKDMYNSATKMTNTDGVYTLSVYLKEGEEFMFTSQNTIGSNVTTGTEYLRASNLDEAAKALIDQTATYNMIAKATGTYTFTYTASTKVLTATFDSTAVPAATDYYIDGTFAEGVADWSGYCFNADYKLTQVGTSDVYEIKNVTMKADSQIIIQAFKAGSTERGEWGTAGYNGLGSYNYTYLYNGGEAFTVVGGGNNNIKVVTAGTYDITFNSYAKIITITEHVESADTLDIYIKGSNINSWSNGFSQDWRLILSADKTKYEFTITVEADKAVEFGMEKHPKGETTGYGTYIGAAAIGTSGDANSVFTPASGSNFTCSTAGTYKVVYDIATEKVDFYAVS